MKPAQSPIAFRHPPGEHVSIPGKRLWVERHGHGEPVLALAGFGPAGSHVVFHPHLDALAEDHHVVYVDLHRRGRSDVPDDLHAITFAGDVDDVAALLRRLGLGPVHLFGFSYGGLLAQALALDHPGMVKSVVLANSLSSPQMWQQNHANVNREIANQYPEVWAEIQRLRAQGVRSTDPRMSQLFGPAARVVRFFDPDNAAQVATEPGARNLALYPVFCGDDVDFTVGGQIPAIAEKIEWHYTPKHGSWLNVAECEFAILTRQCLSRRTPTIGELRHRVEAWENARNERLVEATWRFTTADARIKLHRLYPSTQ